MKQEECKKENQDEILIDQLNKMKPFDQGFIPRPPIVEKDFYINHVIPNYIRCGAIPKDELIVGETYKGECRNAEEAVWKGDHFEYIRKKFGCEYTEKIIHFEDGWKTHYDVFVPIKHLK